MGHYVDEIVKYNSIFESKKELKEAKPWKEMKKPLLIGLIFT